MWGAVRHPEAFPAFRASGRTYFLKPRAPVPIPPTMLSKLIANENAWVAADNLERLKNALTALGLGAALLVGLAGLVIGLLQA